ncbi:MAG: chemotaxis protein CheX [Helicobacteraceae bacterium]
MKNSKLHSETFSGLLIYELRSAGSVKELFKAVLEQERRIKDISARGVFLSLQNVSYEDLSELTGFVASVRDLAKSLKVLFGFTNYSQGAFDELKNITANSGVMLAKDKTIAALLTNNLLPKPGESIIVYDENDDIKNVVYIKFLSMGLNVVLAQDTQDFKARTANGGFTYRVFNSRLNEENQEISVVFQSGFFIYGFNGFLNEDIAKDFNFKRHKERLKKGFKVFFINLNNAYYISKKAINFLNHIDTFSKKYGAVVYFYHVKEGDKKFFTGEIKSDFNDCRDSAADLIQLPKPPAKITRTLADLLPNFLNAVYQVLKNYGFQTLTNKVARVKNIKIQDINQARIAGISITGDLDLSVFLCFSDEVVNFIFQSVFFEDPQNDDEINDLLKEVLNTVAGRIKEILQGLKIPVSISMPNAFGAKDDFTQCISFKNVYFASLVLDGMQIDVLICKESVFPPL